MALTQADIANGFAEALQKDEVQKALKIGKYSAGGSGSGASSGDASDSDLDFQDPGGRQDKIDKDTKSALAKLSSYGIDVSGGMAAAIKTQITALYDHQAKKSNEAQKQLDYFYNAREQLGGIAIVPEEGMERMGELARIAVEGFEDVLVSATAGVDSGLEFADGTMQGMDPMVNFFKDAKTAAEKFGQVVNAIGTDTPMALKKLTTTSKKELTFFAETLKLTDQQTSDLIKRQYAFTGEANADVMGEIANVTKALSFQTGLTARSLKEDILAITTDIDKFGNIGVDSAGRIAAALGQLGIDFQSFNRLTDQFMDFDSAANKMGELSSLFGIQMDAMEMTYLANEDQEEFLFRMREEIMDSGIDVENMSNTRARALASQLNMDVAQMKTFLREGELAIDQTGMETATGAAESMDGLTTAGKYFGNQFARDMKKPIEVIEEALIPSLIKNREHLIRNRNATEQLNIEMQKLKFPDELAEIQAEFINFDTFETDMKRMVAEKTFVTINSYGEKFGDMLTTTIDGFTDKRKKVQVEIDALLKEGYGFDPTRIEDFRIVGKDYIGAVEDISSGHVDKLTALSNADIAQNTVDRVKVSEALKQMGIKDKKIDDLITQMQQGAVVQINVDMNADKVADTMFQIHKKNGHFAVAAANPK